MGKCFCLRGGQEHRDLCPSRLQSPDRYMYKEKASKNRQGGIAQLKLEHKAVFIFRNPEAGVRCPVHLFDKYMSKLPPEVFFKDFFYCRPLSVVPIDPAKPWYVASPVGRNQLGKMVSTMCELAGITGVKTNHSLRVSGASALFDAGVPERIIQGRTGHRCLESLRVYERVTNQQNQKVSKILSGSLESFNEADSSSITSNQPSTSVNISDDHFETKRKMKDASCSGDASKSGGSSAAQQYNNCTVNMYMLPPYYPPMPLHDPYLQNPPYLPQMPLSDHINYLQNPAHWEDLLQQSGQS